MQMTSLNVVSLLLGNEMDVKVKSKTECGGPKKMFTLGLINMKDGLCNYALMLAFTYVEHVLRASN